MSKTVWMMLVAGTPAMAQAPIQQVWARQAGTAATDGAVATVPVGTAGVLIAGNTAGALGGAAAGFNDVFLIRGDAAGNQVWITQFGSAMADNALDMASPGNGNSQIVGQTAGVLGLANLGGTDGFIAVHSAAGAMIGVQQFGTPLNDAATGIDMNGPGDSVICGWTEGNLAGANAGGEDAYVLLYDVTGNNLLWAQQFGTGQDDQADAVTLFGAGSVTVGSTEGNLGAANAGGSDVFLIFLGPAGNPVWVRQFGSADSDVATDVAADGMGGVVVTGITLGNLVGVNQGLTDIFLARYDAAGNQVWLRQFGTPQLEVADRLETFGTTMLFSGRSDGSLWGTNLGSGDSLLARFDAVGNAFIWGYQYGTPQSDNAGGLAADSSGKIYASGSTGGDLGAPNAGGLDAYLVRFGPACYADCNGAGGLTIADFGCFQAKFAAADMYADCNGSGTLTIADFGCFQAEFAAGCP